MSVLDWSPWPRSCQTLLTQKELEAFRKVKTACHAAQSGERVVLNGLATDVLALCETIKRISQLKQNEFGFPQQAALVNRAAEMAYTLRFNGKLAAENVVDLLPTVSPQSIFEMMTESQVSDALLFVRPYMELVEPKTQDAMEDLRSRRFTVEVDGYKVINNSAVDEFLTDLDGHSLGNRLFSFANLVPICLLPAVTLKNGEAVRNDEIGIFLPNASGVRMCLSGSTYSTPMKIRIGMVLGMYTTKPI